MRTPPLKTTVIVHETAFLEGPVWAAVSRVTLQTWSTDYHPKTPSFHISLPAIPRCIEDALNRIESAAPGFRHGMLIHDISDRYLQPHVEPNIATIRQYATRFTTLGTSLIQVPAESGLPDGLVLHRKRSRDVVPRWVWHHLAATLLHPARTVGDPPPDLA